jgi:hypothetical protein
MIASPSYFSLRGHAMKVSGCRPDSLKCHGFHSSHTVMGDPPICGNPIPSCSKWDLLMINLGRKEQLLHTWFQIVLVVIDFCQGTISLALFCYLS